MESTGTQASFFQHIKSLLPQHKSLVDEVADLLDISNDSSYRHIRDEKPISKALRPKKALQGVNISGNCMSSGHCHSVFRQVPD